MSNDPSWDGEPEDYEPGSFKVHPLDIEGAAAAERQRTQETCPVTQAWINLMGLTLFTLPEQAMFESLSDELGNFDEYYQS